MTKIKNKFKSGAASFYIVAFSTLILMIVAISFATVIISEVERTSNDDLSQSAYDSALAGIEDAKLAYYNYQNCLMQEGAEAAAPNGDSTVTCPEILWYMDEANRSKLNNEDNCSLNTVWNILGKGATQGEVVEVSNGVNNNMQQATTCVTMTNKTKDYKGNLSSSNAVDVIELSFAGEVDVDAINSVKLSWFSREDAARAVSSSGSSISSYSNKFPISAALKEPPVVSFTLLQTGGQTFTMESFNQVGAGQTNRGTLFLVPQGSGNSTPTSINADRLVKSNDKTVQNEPIKVGCDNLNSMSGEYACSAMIGLPKPIGGEARNVETFEVIVSLPYGQPDAEFALQFYCGGNACGEVINGEGGSAASVATLEGVQIEVDSTGRANDLYRRVVTRLKNKSDLSLTVMGPLELLDSGGNDAGMTKTWPVIKEYNFN